MTKKLIKTSVFAISSGLLLLATNTSVFADHGGRGGDSGGHRGRGGSAENLLRTEREEFSEDRHRDLGAIGFDDGDILEDEQEDFEDDDEFFHIRGGGGVDSIKTVGTSTTSEFSAVSARATATRELLSLILPTVDASSTATYGDVVNSLAGFKRATLDISRYIPASSSAALSFSSSLVFQIDALISSVASLGVTTPIPTSTEKISLLQKLDDINNSMSTLYRAVLISLQ